MNKLGEIIIFCEGKSDQRFLRDFIKVNYNIEITDEELKKNQKIRCLDGWQNLEKLKSTITEEYSNYTSLIFLDADDDRVQGKAGKLETDKFVDDLMSRWNWKKYDKYIFPNNQDNGEIEDFFEKIINPKNNNIFGCWIALNKCLSNNYYTWNSTKKAKIYFYHEVLLSDITKCKEENRNFTDTDIWEALNNVNDNLYLKNLKSFLDKYINE